MIGPKTAMPSVADEKRAYQIVTERDNGVCVRCRRGGVVQRDHRQNRMVGNTVPSNLQLLCVECHAWKTVNPQQALRTGYSILRHTTLTPAETPARRWLPTLYGTQRRGWVLYLDEPEHDLWWREIADIEAHYLLKAAGVLA